MRLRWWGRRGGVGMVGESVCIVVELRRRSCLSGIAAGCVRADDDRHARVDHANRANAGQKVAGDICGFHFDIVAPACSHLSAIMADHSKVSHVGVWAKLDPDLVIEAQSVGICCRSSKLLRQRQSCQVLIGRSSRTTYRTH